MSDRLECLVSIFGQDRKTTVRVDSSKIVSWIIGIEVVSGVTIDDLLEIQENFPDADNYKLLKVNRGYSIVGENFNEKLLSLDITKTGVLIPSSTIEQIVEKINEIALNEIYY